MVRIQEVTAPPQLGSDDVTLRREFTGWVWGKDLFEIVLKPEGGLSTYKSIQVLWEQWCGLLGPGTMTFHQMRAEPATGYLTFSPKSVS